MTALVAVLSFALILALMGWGVTNALISRGKLDEAKALEIHERVNTHIDERIAGALARAKSLQPRKGATDEGQRSASTVLDDVEEFLREQRRKGVSTVPATAPTSPGELGEMPIED